MKKILKDIKNATGKTLSDIDNTDDLMALHFVDDSVLLLRMLADPYGGDNVEVEIASESDTGTYTLRWLNVISEEEYQSRLKLEEQRAREITLRRERELFESLKKKFGE